MKRKAVEIIVASIMGAMCTVTPMGQPIAPEREIIDLPWDFGTVEEETELTAYNIDLLARVCMSEAGHEPFIGKVAVVTTVLNRCDNWNKTTEEIVYAPNQYWTGNNGTPTEECYSAVAYAIENRDLFPADMMWFRKNHYHNFAHPYIPIGVHYFSTETDRRGEIHGNTL